MHTRRKENSWQGAHIYILRDFVRSVALSRLVIRENENKKWQVGV